MQSHIMFENWSDLSSSKKSIFVCFDAFHPIQQFISHVRMISCLSGLKQVLSIGLGHNTVTASGEA